MPTPRSPLPLTLITLLAAATVLAGAAPARAKTYSLPELIELARKNNPSLAASAQQTALIEAQLAEAQRSRLPSGELTSLVAPSPEIRCQAPDETLFTRNPGESDKTFRERNCFRTEDREATLKLTNPVSGIVTRTEIRLVQPIYTFGKIAAGIDAAEKGIEASRGREAATAAELELNIKKAYWGWKAAREAVATIEEGLGHIEEGMKKVEETIKDGDGAPTDRFRIQSAQVEAKLRLQDARKKAEYAKSALRTLVGPVEGDLAIDEEPLEPLTVPERTLAHHLEQARQSRPEVLALRHLVAARRAQADLEKRKMFPDLVLIGQATYAYSSSVDNPYFAFGSDPYNTKSFGLVLALRAPLDFGPKSARWAQARAIAAEAAARQDEALGGIDLEVKKAHSEVVEAGERRALVTSGEKVATRWLTAITASFEVGTAEAKDFSDALLPYFTFRLRALEATYDFNVAVATLSRATGADVTTAR